MSTGTQPASALRLATRMQRLGAEGFATVLAEAARLRAQGRSLIAMHAGEPDFDTPANVVEAAANALRAGQTRYAPTVGQPGLRAAAAEYLHATRSLDIAPEQIVIAPGAKPLIYFALLALCQAGDEVICPDPGYPIYASLASFVGATPVSLPMTLDTGFRFDLDQLRALITPRTRVIVLNSPSNPTGGVLGRRELEAVAELALANDLIVLSDEIYSRIVYAGQFESIASLPGLAERTVLVDGFSKTYAMTGWRLGFAALPHALVPAIGQLVLNTLSSTTTFIQPAGVEALTGPQVEVAAMVEAFRRRRDRIVAGLRALPGVQCLAPAGAFYVFPRFSSISLGSAELSQRLLEEGGVVTYPGTAFGAHGEGFVRLSFACAESDIDEGLKRIGAVLDGL